MRIITGSARGALLSTLEGEATRPTADRVKEALFSMIQFDIEGRSVLDLFAGSGQLGLEALSRGAESCVFTDSSREAADIVLANAKKTGLFDRSRISSTDFETYLKGAAGRDVFDLIFLDPPYASDFTARALRLIADGELLRAGGRIVCESDNGTILPKKKLAKDPEYNKTQVLSQVFGGDGELAERYETDKTSLYGRTRITLLSLKK